MPQLDSDAFTYSDGNLATVSGGKWTQLSSFADVQVASNKVQSVPGVDAAAEITSWAGSATDHYSQVVVSGTIEFSGPTVRSNGVGSFYLVDPRANGDLVLYYVNAGSFNQIDVTNVGSIVAGDVVYLEAQGTTLVAKVNGVTKITKTDASLATGKPGIRCYSTNPQLDSWAAGDFGAGASGIVPITMSQRRRRMS